MLYALLEYIHVNKCIISYGKLCIIKCYSLPYFAFIFLLLHSCYKNTNNKNIGNAHNSSFEYVQFMICSCSFFCLFVGRLFHILFYQKNASLTGIFDLSTGGMSAIGVLFGSGICMLFCVYFKIINLKIVVNIANEMSFFMPSIILSGRFSNFINGELFGKKACNGIGFFMIPFRESMSSFHPAQIYEGVLVFFTCYFLFSFVKIFLFIFPNKKSTPLVSNMMIFVVGYSISRIAIEPLKTNNITLMPNTLNSQILLIASAFLFISQVIFIYKKLNVDINK